MGRHSAPDEEDGEVIVAAPAPTVRPRPGRHARPDEDDPARVAVPEPPSIAAPPVGKGNQSTAADLELLRVRSDVRARVIAAVLVPFVLYTVGMFLAGALDVYVIWMWLPLVTAGVVAGSILDAAHRKRSRTPDEPAP